MSKRQPPLKALLDRVDSDRPVIEGFLAQVRAVLEKTPEVSTVVHSYKARVKSRTSLGEKISAKRKDGKFIDQTNIYRVITDVAGVRLLHLFPKDIATIHHAIERVVQANGWVYRERPKAYSWDPESVSFLKGLGIRSTLKPSYYTSVHYVVMPNSKANVCCEIQVRTLFEEIWGEIEHKLKYKSGVVEKSTDEHLGVLARLVAVGARVCDALHKPNSE